MEMGKLHGGQQDFYKSFQKQVVYLIQVYSTLPNLKAMYSYGKNGLTGIPMCCVKIFSCITVTHSQVENLFLNLVYVQQF